METPQIIGIIGVGLGAGITSVRIAANRLGWNFPAPVDYTLGVAGILLIAVCLTLLLRWFAALFGTELPPDSPWPATLLYAVISAALIFAAGYLPAHIAPNGSPYKTHWDPAVAESFFLNLENFEAGKHSTSTPVKIVATEKGTPTARLIAQIMTHFGWRIQVNNADGSHVFPASAPFRGARIRYRQTRNYVDGTERLFHIVSALAEVPNTEHFPETDEYNFSEIGIGDPPEYYTGPSRFMNDTFR